MTAPTSASAPVVEIYTDGGCEPNPGPGGYGAVLLHPRKRAEVRENERCDQLAIAALRQPNLPVDDGYENKPETEGVRPDMQEGEPCRKCSTPVIKRKGKWKPTSHYYYEFHLWCPKCEIAYHVESAKRSVEQPPSLF